MLQKLFLLLLCPDELLESGSYEAMPNIINGNILETEENVIVQQVNCMGVMGAGLAKQIREKYPKVYSEYLNYCNKHAEDRKKLAPSVVIIELKQWSKIGLIKKVDVTG
jgi:O-acetyl-ADP-ribose deacetylase (regulator of RNase III)